MTSLFECASRLHTIQIRLKNSWIHARNVWRDKHAMSFETEFLVPNEKQFQRILEELNKLAQTSENAKRHVK